METFIPVCNKSSWMYTSPRLACPSPALCSTACALLLWAVWVALQLGWMGNSRCCATLCRSEHHLSCSQSTSELLCSHRSDLYLYIGAASRTGLSHVALPLAGFMAALSLSSAGNVLQVAYQRGMFLSKSHSHVLHSR